MPMPCPVGRTFDPLHATCGSCPVDCHKGGTKRTRKTGGRSETVNTAFNGRTLVTTARIEGLNKWNNKDRHAYLMERQKWKRILNCGAVYVWGIAKGRRRVTVTRYVANRTGLIRDADNLASCLKPVKDVMTRMQLLIDDSMEFMDSDVFQQIDSSFPRTEILVEDI